MVGLAAAPLAWIFIALASAVAQGETRAFDLAILRVMQTARESQHGVATVMLDLNAPGSTADLALFKHPE